MFSRPNPPATELGGVMAIPIPFPFSNPTRMGRVVSADHLWRFIGLHDNSWTKTHEKTIDFNLEFKTIIVIFWTFFCRMGSKFLEKKSLIYYYGLKCAFSLEIGSFLVNISLNVLIVVWYVIKAVKFCVRFSINI